MYDFLLNIWEKYLFVLELNCFLLGVCAGRTRGGHLHGYHPGLHRNDDDFMELEDKIQEFMLYFERAWLGKMVVGYNKNVFQ